MKLVKLISPDITGHTVYRKRQCFAHVILSFLDEGKNNDFVQFSPFNVFQTRSDLKLIHTHTGES